jgi:hypothetical protein
MFGGNMGINAGQLYDLIKNYAVNPDTVRVGVDDDRATWTWQHLPGATAGQIAAAQAAVAAFNLASLDWIPIRALRDVFLAACDWTQMADAPLSVGQREQWQLYRQALRNIPQSYATPAEVVWPTPPE